MNKVLSRINDLTSFMQTEVYASLDDLTKAALVRKKVELCGNYFLQIASNLNRNKYKGCYALHKVVMILAIMKLVELGQNGIAYEAQFLPAPRIEVVQDSTK